VTSGTAALPFGLTERNMLIIGGLIVAIVVLVCLCLAVTLSLSSRP
jgi:hypothetical protein